MQQNTQQMTTSAPASTSPKLALKSGLGLPLSRPPPLARLFSEVELGSMRFLILDCPTEQNLHHYLTVCPFLFPRQLSLRYDLWVIDDTLIALAKKKT